MQLTKIGRYFNCRQTFAARSLACLNLSFGNIAFLLQNLLMEAAKLLSLTLSLTVLTTVAKAQGNSGHSDVLLFRAQMTSVARANAVDNEDSVPAGRIVVGGPVAVALSSVEFLIGEPRPMSSVVLRMASWPRADRLYDIYVLARIPPSQDIEVIGWAPVERGLCVDPEPARQLGIETQLAALYKSAAIKRCL